MIENRDDYNYYIKMDRAALRIPEKRKGPRPFLDIIWKYEIVLRKAEFYTNYYGKNSIFSKYYRLKLWALSKKYSVYIPINVFGPGLSIAHACAIVVNQNAKVGKNCRIQEGVTIGATNGSDRAPQIGDNCFLGSGAKIIGDIYLLDNIAVGAGAVVVKSFDENCISIAGVPAKIVSHNGSKNNVLRK